MVATLHLTNSGTLSAEADADFAVALTTFNLARGRYANAYTTNASDANIYAEATGNYTIAEAINNGAARYGNAATSNAGGIYATANGTSGAGGRHSQLFHGLRRDDR